MLISGPPHTDLPTGLSACPAGARQFLSVLAERGEAKDEPARVSDPKLGLTVLSGSEALSGRDARVRAARGGIDRAKATLDDRRRPPRPNQARGRRG